MKERPILFSAPMVRAILDGRKTQTRRIVKHPADWEKRGAWNVASPYGKPGDRLWVRETWRADRCYDHLAPRDIPVNAPIFYDENGNIVSGYHKRRPGMFMMRRMSRITLEVTGVRVERLQEISEQDAMAEGVNWQDSAGMARFTARKLFAELWDSINAKRAPWASNPWVWVVEFRRVES